MKLSRSCHGGFWSSEPGCIQLITWKMSLGITSEGISTARVSGTFCPGGRTEDCVPFSYRDHWRSIEHSFTFKSVYLPGKPASVFIRLLPAFPHNVSRAAYYFSILPSEHVLNFFSICSISICKYLPDWFV